MVRFFVPVALAVVACHDDHVATNDDGGIDGSTDSASDWSLTFDGTPGTAVTGAIKDSGPHHLDATAGDAITFAVGHPAGVIGVTLPGTSTISVTDPAVATIADFGATDAFTLEVGFRTDTSTGTLFARNGAWSIAIIDGQLAVTAGAATATLAGIVSDGRWHRAIVTRDNGELSITIDGVSSASAASTDAITGDPTLTIGDGFLGSIDHVALLRHATPAFAPVATAASTIFHAETGYAAVRIPSIVRANDGTLVVAAEGRVDTADDLGNIDLVVKRSTDNGKTWSALQRVADAGVNKVGNPILFADTDADRLVLLSLVTPVAAGTPSVQVQHSDDHGATWTVPVDITSQVMDESWNTGVLVGPAHGIQLHTGPNAGTLVVHGMHRRKSDNLRGGHLWISRDHGETWSIGAMETASAPDVNVNEGSLAELTDGRLYVNVRNSVDDVEAARATGICGEAFVTPDLAYASNPPFARTLTFRGPVVEGATFR